jgi:hypothetical protein
LLRANKGSIVPLLSGVCTVFACMSFLATYLNKKLGRVDSFHLLFLAFRLFELCQRTQQPSLTFHLVGGSTFDLWPLFHLRDGKEMDRNDCHTAWGNFKTLIYSLHHYKNDAWFFSLFDFFPKKCCYFYLSYLVPPSTGCKSQLF